MAKNTNEVSGWVGWIGFATAMLYLVGFFHLVAGLAALVNDKVYVLTDQALWLFDTTQWGWVHVIGGLIIVAAASSLLKGNAFGRTVAVIAALASAVANMAFMPVYPLWSILMITVSILVIFAVVKHGAELKG